MKIISGGQTGVDRAALDVAIARGMSWGGWCPKGGWAEDFPDPPGLLSKYPELRETPSSQPAQRTEWNVRDSDAILVIEDREGLSVSKGTRGAQEWANRTGSLFSSSTSASRMRPRKLRRGYERKANALARIWRSELADPARAKRLGSTRTHAC